MPLITLETIKGQCNGKNKCIITAVKVNKLGDCAGRSASFLHVIYGPSTCGNYNSSKLNIFMNTLIPRSVPHGRLLVSQ